MNVCRNVSLDFLDEGDSNRYIYIYIYTVYFQDTIITCFCISQTKKSFLRFHKRQERKT